MFFAVAWGASAVVFLFSSQFGIAHYVHPITLTCMFAVFLINTLNFNFRHCRFWLLKALVSAFYLKIVFNSSYICGFCFGAFFKNSIRSRQFQTAIGCPSFIRAKRGE